MASTLVAPHAPPGPPPWRAAAELVALRRDLLGWVEDRRARWGDVFAVPPPLGIVGPTFTWACGPASIRDVLTAAEYEKDSPVYREMAAALGDGLLTSEGDRWKAQRRTLQPLFTRRRVHGYASAFVAAARSVTRDWRDRGVVDLDREMQLLSLRSAGVTLFGTDVTDQIEPIVAATALVSAVTVRRGLSLLPLPRRLPTRTYRQLDRAQRLLEERTDALVDRQRDGAADRDDLVSLLLTAADPETGEPLSAVEVREQALVFLLAGHDTTSTAMTFALHLLAQHPEVQEQVREEARAAGGPEGPDPDAVGALTLTRRVVDEALRLYPPAYITSRRTARPTQIDGYPVAAGGVVATSFWALHRNPDVWDDPGRFAPDRFLPAAAKGRDRYAYLPFGGGPRSCIGDHFALLEATLGVATVIARWRLASRTAHVPLSVGVTLRPAAPVHAELAAV